MDIEVGQIISSTVEEVADYGVWCISDNSRVLVLIPEIQWYPRISDCRAVVAVGQKVDVKIVRRTGEREFSGSIKQAVPANNPFTNGLLSVGSTYCGRVLDVVCDAVTGSDVGFVVRIPPGIDGFLRSNKMTANIRKGDEVSVDVKRIDENKEDIDFVLSQLEMER